VTGPLESRFRRLIALYPAGHRAVYAEDMINALMDGARPGQRRPHLRTTVDLLKGAAAAWILRFRARGRGWQRVAAPPAVAVLALLILGIHSIGATFDALDGAQFTPYRGRLAVVVLLPHLIWLPILVAAAVGLRRPAMWAAWVVGIGWPLLNTASGVSGWAPSFLGSPDQFPWLPVALLAAAGLGVERGVRQGFQALGRTGSLAAVLGVLILGLTLATGPAGPQAPPPAGTLLLGPGPAGPQLSPDAALLLLIIGLALLVPVCLGAAGLTGRSRVLATVTAVGALVLLAGGYTWSGSSNWYWNLRLQLSSTVPLTLLICSLIAGLRTVRAKGSPGSDLSTAAPPPA
jgi:hypothetical protein